MSLYLPSDITREIQASSSSTGKDALGRSRPKVLAVLEPGDVLDSPGLPMLLMLSRFGGHGTVIARLILRYRDGKSISGPQSMSYSQS